MKNLTALKAYIISKSVGTKLVNLKRTNQCVRKCLKEIKKEAAKGSFKTEVVFDKFVITKEEKSHIIWELSQLGFKMEHHHNERYHTIFKISWDLIVENQSNSSLQ